MRSTRRSILRRDRSSGHATATARRDATRRARGGRRAAHLTASDMSADARNGATHSARSARRITRRWDLMTSRRGGVGRSGGRDDGSRRQEVVTQGAATDLLLVGWRENSDWNARSGRARSFGFYPLALVTMVSLTRPTDYHKAPLRSVLDRPQKPVQVDPGELGRQPRFRRRGGGGGVCVCVFVFVRARRRLRRVFEPVVLLVPRGAPLARAFLTRRRRRRHRRRRRRTRRGVRFPRRAKKRSRRRRRERFFARRGKRTPRRVRRRRRR